MSVKMFEVCANVCKSVFVCSGGALFVSLCTTVIQCLSS